MTKQTQQKFSGFWVYSPSLSFVHKSYTESMINATVITCSDPSTVSDIQFLLGLCKRDVSLPPDYMHQFGLNKKALQMVLSFWCYLYLFFNDLMFREYLPLLDHMFYFWVNTSVWDLCVKRWLPREGCEIVNRSLALFWTFSLIFCPTVWSILGNPQAFCPTKDSGEMRGKQQG